MSRAQAALNRLGRAVLRPLGARLGARRVPIRALRVAMVLAALGQGVPRGVRREGDWFRPGGGRRDGARGDRIILWLHGGAHVAGSRFTHRGLAGRLARASGMAVVLPEYPLAPEHPAPAGFEAVLAFWRDLRRSRPACSIILGGDSAGGGLALALLSHLGGSGEDLPAGLLLASPWTDLTLSGESLVTNAARDPMIPAEVMPGLIERLRGDLAAGDPRLSPLFGRFPAPPPALILVGDSEVLLSDSLRMAEKLRAGGGRVELDVLPDAPHALPWLAPWLPEARAAIRRMAGFACALDGQAEE
ncbi:alpha/beta hydrolase fold domain-containing protein [Pseudogemmobacter sonorensis]|uniref:alpha/beta hydrolase fold domain-containing protein n=1 Tax=Pseudogemmobacter sonorensis TaxID=2989681 RepID=UPI00369D7B41